jgi:transposase
MSSPQKRPSTFPPSTRRYFARLIRKHGILGAVERSKIAVSAATLLRIAREFEIELRPGRRPMAESHVVPPKLSRDQRYHLRQLLSQPARLHGYNSDHWTMRRVAEMIRRTFAVECLSCHAESIVRAAGMATRRSVVVVPPTDARRSENSEAA